MGIFDPDDVITVYTLNEAIEDGVLVEVFKNRWDELSGGKPIVATRHLFEEVSLAGLREIWNEFGHWKKHIEKTRPEEKKLFHTKMNEGEEEDSEFKRGEVIRYFCDLGETDQFAYLFQIYNTRLRRFDEFSGRDIMPLYIVDLIRQVRGLFDYLVIATPYHDIASKEWGQIRWVRNVDPFLLGFVRQVPELVFFLGRWSGRALFPRIGDMIADTIEHLNQAKSLLANVSEGSWRWYRTETRVDFENTVVGPRLKPIESYSVPKISLPRSKLERVRWRRENHSLVKFAEAVRGKFEEGNLFYWLRGEKEEAVTLHPQHS